MNTAIKREGVFLSIIIAIVFSMVFMVQGVIKADSESSVTITASYENGFDIIPSQKVKFEEGDTAWDLLDKVADNLDYEESEWGKTLLGINGVVTDFDKDGAYWEFYVNNDYADVGIEGYKLQNEDVILFRTRNKSFEIKDPEALSDAQATILGSGIQLSSMADLLVSGEYNKGKVASLTDGKLTYDIVDSRGVEDTYKLQYTVSDFVHEDGEATLNFVDESFTNEAKSVETVDPLNKTNFDGEINLTNLDLEDGFVKAGNYSATATIEIVEVPNP